MIMKLLDPVERLVVVDPKVDQQMCQENGAAGVGLGLAKRLRPLNQHGRGAELHLDPPQEVP